MPWTYIWSKDVIYASGASCEGSRGRPGALGHTHKLFYDKHNGLAMMNPGSIGAPLWGCMPSYGIITFDKEHDVMKLDVDYIEY